MASTGFGTRDRLRRTVGGLLPVGIAFAMAATLLSSTFDWPDISGEPEPAAAGPRS